MQPEVVAESVALLVVAATGMFLSLLGCMAFIARERAKAFLLGFAATPRRHYAELAVRMAVGLSLLMASPQLPWPWAYQVAGTVLVVTTAVIAMLPFRLHQAFARESVPRALAYLPLIGAVSLAVGVGIAWSVFSARVA